MLLVVGSLGNSVHDWLRAGLGMPHLPKEELQMLLDMVCEGRGSLTWLLGYGTSVRAQGYVHWDTHRPDIGEE